MNLLLDTHALLWWFADSPLLSDKAREAIENSDGLVYVSAVSVWEVSVKRALGKLRAPDDLAARIESSSFSPMNITIAHAMAAGELPRHHQDPFDRMLIAQANLEQCTLVSRDRRILEYEIPLIW